VYRTFESLYIGRNDNGSGHYVFDIRTGCQKSVARVTPLSMPQRVTDRINAMGLHNKQPKDIVIGDRNDQQTVNDFNLGLEENEEDDDDATDASFDPAKDKDVEQAGDHEVKDYPLIGVRANTYMRVNGHIWSANYKWISFGQY
jgi:hypothetical protein